MSHATLSEVELCSLAWLAYNLVLGWPTAKLYIKLPVFVNAPSTLVLMMGDPWIEMFQYLSPLHMCYWHEIRHFDSPFHKISTLYDSKGVLSFSNYFILLPSIWLIYLQAQHQHLMVPMQGIDLWLFERHHLIPHLRWFSSVPSKSHLSRYLSKVSTDILAAFVLQVSINIL